MIKFRLKKIVVGIITHVIVAVLSVASNNAFAQNNEIKHNPILMSDPSDLTADNYIILATVPLSMQGVWSTDCEGAASGDSALFAYGPNLDVTAISTQGNSTSIVIEVRQTSYGWAVVEDGAFDPNNNQAIPDINISVYTISPDSAFHQNAVFNVLHGLVIQNSGEPIWKCPSNSAFSDILTQAKVSAAPTEAEIVAANTALSQMPAIPGITYAYRIWSPVAKEIDSLTSESPYLNAIPIGLSQFSDADTYQGQVYDSARQINGECQQIDQNSANDCRGVRTGGIACL